MKNAKVLDCTLRDGAYLVDKTFGDPVIKGIIDGLVKSKIDFIEIGFFQDDGFGPGKTVFKNSEDAKRFIPQNKEGCEFTVLADYSRYNVLENLDKCRNDSVDAVRECFFKHERYDALKYCKHIKELGYKVFVQPVDILGYTDSELLEFIEEVNKIEPYSLSIVDTFGSMYQEDLHRIFELIDHNLISTCKIGMHSHNNMQLSSALTQEFLRLSSTRRDCVIDGTICGMGRGAGNTPTELIIQYMNTHMDYDYNVDTFLDIIDNYMDNIRTRCTWGYSTPFFIAGCYSAHVNNIAYLMKKNSIRSKDIRYILNKIGATARKRYDYDLLEKTYIDYLKSDFNDEENLAILSKRIKGKPVLIIAPGKTTTTEVKNIKDYIDTENPVVIGINFIHDSLPMDYLYFSNTRRYEFWSKKHGFSEHKKIVTSNIAEGKKDNEIIVNFLNLIKVGNWEHLDNSTFMLLRLLDKLQPSKIAIAGLDGYDFEQTEHSNYATKELEITKFMENSKLINEEISEMLRDFLDTRKLKNVPVSMITSSRFSYLL